MIRNLLLKLFITLLFSFLVINYAHSEENVSIPIQNIIGKNISTPEENLKLLRQLNDQKKIEWIKQLTSDSFVNSNEFIALNKYVKQYTMNSGNVTDNRINKFSVDDEARIISVTFEHRPNGTKGNWYVKHIVEIRDGRATPLAFEQDHPVYREALPPFSEDTYFFGFTELWKKVMSENNDLNLTPLSEQQAILENVVFYSGQCNQHNNMNTISIASITMSLFPPKPKKIENGWLITDFSYKEYNLSKESDFFQPIYLNEFRPKKTQQELTPNIESVAPLTNSKYKSKESVTNDPYSKAEHKRRVSNNKSTSSVKTKPIKK